MNSKTVWVVYRGNRDYEEQMAVCESADAAAEFIVRSAGEVLELVQVDSPCGGAIGIFVALVQVVELKLAARGADLWFNEHFNCWEFGEVETPGKPAWGAVEVPWVPA